METVGPVLEILLRSWDCISKSANTFKDLKTNQEALQTALDQLNDMDEDVKRRVALEEEKQMVRSKQVNTWLRKVEAIDESAKDALEKASQRRSCCLGCWSSYKLGEELTAKLKAVEELKNEAKFDFVAEALPRNVADERPLEDMIGMNSPFEQVQGWIKDSEVKVIGIHGMGGVGKTTLLKKINNSFVKTNYGFDQVIWVVVSKQSNNIEKVQDAICEQLKLPENRWKNKCEDEKAVQIFRSLGMKKFVLMFDDLWERVDLVRVGVLATSDDPRMSKVIFTTRYEDVCDYMESDKKIKIQCLAREEAVALFRKKVGKSTLNAHPNIPQLAEILAEDCKGLPLALITVGRAMAGKRDPRDWDKAVMKLRKYPSRITGMEDDVFRVLKFSYDSLRNHTIKSCFAYCCIYPEKIEIWVDHLLDLWLGEGLLDEFDDAHEARDQGREIIEGLKAANLLKNGESENYVKMHDVIRGMALWISSGSKAEKRRYLVFDHVDLLKAPLVPTVEAERVSLWGSKIRSVTQVQSWPKALTFIARYTAIRMFPSGFFQFMPILKVLDLSWNTQLEELPTDIGELVKLQFLNLSHTLIRELPVELKNLTRMKYLLLDYAYSMEVIPPQVISSFSLLRVFRLSGNNFASSEDVEHTILGGDRTDLLELLEDLQYINEVSITLFDANSVEKLKNSPKVLNCLTLLSLEHLTSIEFSSSSVERMQHLQSLDIYRCELQHLIIHSEWEDRNGVSSMSCSPDHFLSRGCFSILSNVCISFCDKLLDLTWLIHAPMLEILSVFNCASLMDIVKDDPSRVLGVQVDSRIFSRVKVISLTNVPCLRSVYPRPLPFPSLVEITVYSCDSLRRLPFDFSSAQLGCLKQINGTAQWWAALQWEDEMLEPHFRSYFY